MRRFFVQRPSGYGHLCCRDHHDCGPGHHDGHVLHRCRDRGDGHDRHCSHHRRRSVADPSRDSGNSVATADSNVAWIGNSVAPNSNVAQVGSSAQAANSSRAERSNKNHRRSSKPAPGWSRPRNCNSSNLRRNKVHTLKESNPGTQQEEVGDTWRPPGPRKSHARDAGGRQSEKI